MGTNLQTSKYDYAYMQSMLIPLSASFNQSITGSSSTTDFVQEEQLVVPNEQLKQQKHGRLR